MRLVFMGTPAIAAVCLRRLQEDGHEIVAVYTKPDTPKNRGMKMLPSEVKEAALEYGLRVIQPDTFRDDAVVEELRSLAPDLIACVAYGKILPQRVLDIPALGCVNIHASILPALRGAGPIQWAILNGLEETGVTAMYMAKEMDAGDIIEIVRTPIDPAETSEELTARLAELGAELLSKTVADIAAGIIHRTPQDPEQASYAPMLTKEQSPIDWTRTRRQILDQVRGLIPWPVASCELEGKRFKIYGAEPAEVAVAAEPGTALALDKRGLIIACGDGALRITQLQAEGGKRMSAPDYFRGHPISLP
ncbi:MAG: methionyl-tRNA formyltransferase [Oscillospiraceae bacterium]|nr:methionyl-tRNA formyltransferase [Oscillospiraceae bacterium]